MNIKWQDLLPEELSDESAFQVIQFIQGLLLALGQIYYKRKRTHYKRHEKNRIIVLNLMRQKNHFKNN